MSDFVQAGKLRVYRRGGDGRMGGIGQLTLTIPDSPMFVPARAVQVVASIMRDHMDLATQYLAGVVSEHAPRNLGHLAQSFTAFPATQDGGRELTGARPTEITGRVFSSLPYAIVMAEGRRPGFGISRAGMASLALWVRRKLGLSGKEARSATYAIAYAIKTRGIKGTQYHAKAFQAAKPNLAAIFNAMNAQMADVLATPGESVGGVA